MTAESEQISAIYDNFPRKVGKIAALKAIQKAVTYLVKQEGITPIEARRKLYKATLLYARSPVGQNPDKTLVPHPATWFNRGSYLDDPQEWQHGGTNGTSRGFLTKSEKTLQAAQNAARFDTETADDHRGESTGNSARDGIRDLLQRVGRVPDARLGNGDSGTLLEGKTGRTDSLPFSSDDCGRDAKGR
jgi:hypothetical protein